MHYNHYTFFTVIFNKAKGVKCTNFYIYSVFPLFRKCKVCKYTIALNKFINIEYHTKIEHILF